jgi:hypothetical protein
MGIAIDVIIDGLQRNTEIIKGHLSDLSDTDLLTRPCPGANHPKWQLGHLLVAETNMIGLLGGKGAELSDTFKKAFTNDTAKSDDPSLFPSKAELLETLTSVRAASVAGLRNLKDEDLLKTGQGFPWFAPTYGLLANLFSSHAFMHIGQIQVLRRKLGKPVLF